MKRVSVKSSVGRISFTTTSTPGFCRPMAFSMPIGVSYTRCGLLPRRGLPVVPFRQMPPTSRLEKPATRRVFLAETHAAGQQHDGRGELHAAEFECQRGMGRRPAGCGNGGRFQGRVHAAIIAENRAESPRRKLCSMCCSMSPRSPEYGQFNPSLRQYRGAPAPGGTAGIRPLGAAAQARRTRLPRSGAGERACGHAAPAWRAIGPTRLFVIETDGAKGYHETQFRPGDSLLFGRETSGLPEQMARALPPHERLRIPMRPSEPQPQSVECRGGGGLRGLAAERLRWPRANSVRTRRTASCQPAYSASARAAAASAA